MQKKYLTPTEPNPASCLPTGLKPESPLIEKRTSPRIRAVFPAEITAGENQQYRWRAKTLDLNEQGLRLSLNEPLPFSSILKIQINPSPRYPPLQLEGAAVWSRAIHEAGSIQAGLYFPKTAQNHSPILKKIISDYRSLNEDFARLLEEIRQDLQAIKLSFDDFDRSNTLVKQQNEFIESNKKKVFRKLDDYFNRVWEIIRDFKKEKYQIHQDYYQQVLGYLLLDPIETNRHVYQKPLGYAGDYTMMNYIYDYHRGNYLGSSSYEKLINHYTCNIPISCSNIKRKDFLKRMITGSLRKNNGARILSLASGPARELTELLNAGKINRPLLFKCLDPEKLALDYIREEIKNIEPAKKRWLSIEYLCKNITSLIRDKELKNSLQNYNLIYAFGIFDYLSDKMAKRLTQELFKLLNNSGRLVIFNISLEKNTYRAYYELLGDWDMAHRTQEQMLEWVTAIKTEAKVKFEELPGGSNYLCLNIQKQPQDIKPSPLKNALELTKTAQILGLPHLLKINRIKKTAGSIIGGYYLTRVINTLLNLNLFSELSKNSLVDTRSFCQTNRLNEEALNLLCDYLVAYKILKKRATGYQLNAKGKFILELGSGFFDITYSFEDILHNLEPILKNEKTASRNPSLLYFEAKGAGNAAKLLTFPIIIDIIKRNSFKSVFDIGCGSAEFLIQLCKHLPGVSGCGVDLSVEAVTHGQKQAALNNLEGRIQLFKDNIVTNLEKFSPQINRAEIITFSFVLHELFLRDKEQIIGFLAEFRKKFENKCLLVCENIQQPLEILQKDPVLYSELQLAHGLAGEQQLDRKSWQQIFKQSGFQQVKEHYLAFAKISIYILR